MDRSGGSGVDDEGVVTVRTASPAQATAPAIPQAPAVSHHGPVHGTPGPLPAAAYKALDAVPFRPAIVSGNAPLPVLQASDTFSPIAGLLPVPLPAKASSYAALGQVRPADHTLPLPGTALDCRILPTMEACLPSGILEPAIPYTAPTLRVPDQPPPGTVADLGETMQPPASVAAAGVEHMAPALTVPRLEASPASTPAPGASALRAEPRDLPPPTTNARKPRVFEYLKRGLKIAGLAAAGYLGLVLLAILVFRFVDPPTSMLMIQKRLTGHDVTQEWMPIEAISPNVVRAVLVSEDGRFCQHSGVDFEEMQAAIERAGEGVPRGASTISMQVVKNLFLWPAKSYIRKAIEIPLTYVMELVWPKRRIMEVYLNIAEWGPGVFGVEAASQFHFNKRASRLSEREAARLAVALPNPLLRDAGDPGPMTLRLAGDIQSRMRAAGAYQTACVLKGG
jgi:monofunctional biosynthetic peptidoglycan transglycosylase